MAKGADRFRMPEIAAESPAPRRRPGPMGVAGREVAETVVAATEAQVEARRRNAEEARAWRAAREEGRVLVRVPLEDVATDDLPRDRLGLAALAGSEEMEELKASIRARGQREPVELYRDAAGRLQLKKGWRRLSALKALKAETGEARFAEILARVDEGGAGQGADAAEAAARVALYVDMVEENAVREDLTFAEMASLALAAAADPRAGLASPEEAVARLYGALARMKRSNIRRFVTLMAALGDALPWPKAIGRDLGANVGRRLEEDPALAATLRARLVGADGPERQNAILAAALKTPKPKPETPRPRRFAAGRLTAAASGREVRITAEFPVDDVPAERLDAALQAFWAALEAAPYPAGYGAGHDAAEPREG